jgi:type I restriction enzyme S subunit
MDVNAGYKLTDVGVIPDDWEPKSIADIAPLQRGFDLPSTQINQGKYPVVYSNGVMNYHNQAMVRGPGVITGRSGTLGVIHYIDADYWPHNTSLWVVNFKGNNPRFVYYLYQHVGFQRFASGSGVPTLNRNDAHDYRIGVPVSIREQEAIAGALSDADALIESLEQLIAKKRRIKQGAMQELLNPQNDWTVNPIRSVLEIVMDYRGRTPKKLGMEWGGDIRALSAGNVKMGRIDFNEESYFGSEKLFQKWMTQGHTRKDDVLITTEAPLGNVAVIPDNDKYILSQRVILLRADARQVYSHFLYHLLSSDRFQNALNKDSSGSTATGIQRLKFEKIPIAYPTSVDEQRAIAGVLSDMDAEIAALDDKLNKARQIKQGMMQELLTGRIRLNVGAQNVGAQNVGTQNGFDDLTT